MINVVLASPFRPEAEEIITRAGEGRCRFERALPDTPPKEAAEIFSRADVVIGFAPPEALAAAKRLRWLQMTWAGVDAVAGRLPEGVILTNASGAFGPVIAEHILACLLALCRRLPAYARQGKWRALGSEATLEGRRALILGAGDIGVCTAQRLRPFGTRCVGIRRVAREKPDCFNEMYTLEALDEQLALADAVICCLPGTEQTRGLLNERRLLLMKPDALLVNVGRGSLIDTPALERVLASGRLFGAALDVTEPEPLPESSPLWAMDNVIITPHVAGIGFGHLPETERRIAEICADNLRRFLDGMPLANIVDPALGYRRTVM